MKIILYRGNTKIEPTPSSNYTFPEKFATEGLLTKQLNSGVDPFLHNKADNHNNAINSHINPNTILRCYYFDRTPFLSFSKDFGRAELYLKTQNNYKLEPTENKNEAIGYVLPPVLRYQFKVEILI
ncbi:MAG: hypothetical protein U0Y10_19085 [Spirosomataceae bacterium]